MHLSSACDIFGGKEKVRDALLRSILEEIAIDGFSTTDISACSQLPLPVLKKVLDGKCPLDGNTAMAIMAPLGITIERFLKLRPLSQAERAWWQKHAEEGRTGPVVGSESETISDTDTIVELYIRFKALAELDDSP